MDNTLGIDCPKKYMFDNDNSCLSIGTPRRLSKDFEEGLVGDAVQPQKKRKLDTDDWSGPILRSHSTPRRSVRIQKNTTAPVTKGKLKTATKPRVWKTAAIVPKPNRTLELRKQSALNRGKKPNPSNAIVMKPHFQKPKLAHTVPKTPDLVRRLKAQSKRPPVHIKSLIEKEDEEVQKMKKFKFKAAPVPKAVKAPVPLPNRVKSGKPSTKPVTPKLTKGKKRKFVEEKPKDFKAQPVPDFSKKSVISKSASAEKKHPEVKPFSFDTRYTDRNANRQKLLAEHLKEMREKTVFKATPYFKPGASVAKENKKPSQSVSANTAKTRNYVLPGDAISKKKKEAFQRKVQEEAEKQKAKATFRASSIRGK